MAAFNQEKALVGAFSVIVQPVGSVCSTTPDGADDGGHGEPLLPAVAAGEGGAVPRHQLGLRQPRRELPELPHAEVVRGQGGVSGADLDVGTLFLIRYF